MCNLRERFVNLREGFVEAPWRLREGFAKASRRRHGRLHLETIRQIMTSPRKSGKETMKCHRKVSAVIATGAWHHLQQPQA